ncbi:protein Star-like isoform X2 [Oratosquilla oratoria]|uniref:protein Star-like isoform X2 n=1 Tax=Oratosquilla oratoria TaxID=337810 RepID=UPI003F7636EF
MSGLHTLGRRYGGPSGGVYGRRGDVDMVTPAWLRPRLGRMAPLKILVFTVVLIITLLFMLNARAHTRHVIHPHDALNLTDLDFEGVPQTQPDLIAYIRQLHLRAPPLHGPFYTLHHPDTTDHSQNGQSLRVAQILKGKRGGFFVEAGAYNGEDLSNTLYLERQLGWTGLLVEPDPWNFYYLRNRRRRVHSIHACLSPNPYPREVTFRQSDTMGHILQPEEGGRGLLTRVKCFPLYSLLLALNASSIDFLSLDIEGAEIQVRFSRRCPGRRSRSTWCASSTSTSPRERWPSRSSSSPRATSS